MITIGLIGGIASGKSAVARDFQELGAFVIDADQVGHAVLDLPHVTEQLVARWGTGILGENGEMNRSAIAAIVFPPVKDLDDDSSDYQAELEFLESVTHPEIRAKIQERMEQVRQTGRFEVIVLDAAVMLKTGWDTLCDQLVYVDAPRELREKRAILRGMEASQFASREEAQIPVNEKKKRADVVIDNSGPPQKTFRQVQEVWQSLRKIA